MTCLWDQMACLLQAGKLAKFTLLLWQLGRFSEKLKIKHRGENVQALTRAWICEKLFRLLEISICLSIYHESIYICREDIKVWKWRKIFNVWFIGWLHEHIRVDHLLEEDIEYCLFSTSPVNFGNIAKYWQIIIGCRVFGHLVFIARIV